MDSYIKSNINDITYMSELIPLLSCESKKGGLMLPNNLRSLSLRKLWAYLI